MPCLQSLRPRQARCAASPCIAPGEPVEHEHDRSTEVSNPGEVEGNPLDASNLTDLLFFTYTMDPDDIVYGLGRSARL